MKQYYLQTKDEVLKEFKTSTDGLSTGQAKENLAKYGKNALVEGKKKTAFQVFLEQFKDLMVIILIIAAVISAFTGDLESTLVIIAVLILNAILGTVQHVKAEKSLESLKSLSSPSAKVLRNGEKIEIDSKDVVPGDIMLLEAGDMVTADGRILDNYSLQVNESSLTGESTNIDKADVDFNHKIPLGDRLNMVYSSSLVTYGRANVLVTGTGMNTEIGKIASLMNETKERRTPLQVSLDKFSSQLATAKLDAESREELYKANVVSEYDLQTARNTLAAAEAALAQAKAEEINARNSLSYTEVKSPVDGSASMIPYRVGALVSSSIAQPLVTVSDDAQVYIYFSMSENQIIDLIQHYGSLRKAIEQMPEIEFRLSNGTLYGHAGRVDAISGTVDASTGAVSLRATFDNPEKLLRNGGNGTVIVPTALTDCIVIPQSSTYEIQDKKFVYKVIDGKTESFPIGIWRAQSSVPLPESPICGDAGRMPAICHRACSCRRRTVRWRDRMRFSSHVASASWSQASE